MINGNFIHQAKFLENKTRKKPLSVTDWSCCRVGNYDSGNAYN